MSTFNNPSPVLLKTESQKFESGRNMRTFEILPLEAVRVLEIGLVIDDLGTHFSVFPEDVSIFCVCVSMDVWDREHARLRGCTHCGKHEGVPVANIATPFTPMRVIVKCHGEHTIAVAAKIEPIPLPPSICPGSSACHSSDFR